MLKIVNPDRKFDQYAILLILALIWGSSFILMKKGLESFNFVQVGALRIFAAAVFLLLISFRRLKRVKKEHIKSLVVVGVFGNLLPAFLFTKAQTGINSSLAGILNSLTPVFVLLIGILFYKSKVGYLNMAGLLVALIGSVGIIYKPDIFMLTDKSYYAVFIIVATFFYGISTNEIKYKLSGLDGLTMSVAAFTMILPAAAVYLFWDTTFLSTAVKSENLYALGAILILALFSSAIAVPVYNLLIKSTSAIFASSVTYLIPVVAIFWGIADNETLTLFQLFCIVVVLIGVYLVNKKKSGAQKIGTVPFTGKI